MIWSVSFGFGLSYTRTQWDGLLSWSTKLILNPLSVIIWPCQYFVLYLLDVILNGTGLNRKNINIFDKNLFIWVLVLFWKTLEHWLAGQCLWLVLSLVKQGLIGPLNSDRKVEASLWALYEAFISFVKVKYEYEITGAEQGTIMAFSIIILCVKRNGCKEIYQTYSEITVEILALLGPYNIL